MHNRTKTAWKTLTAATSTCLVKSTTTVYTRTIPSSTVVKTSTHVETKTSTATATVTASSQIIELKRAVGAAKPQPPKCMLNKCFAYTPERVTAACSCINVPPKTVTATHTACSTTKTVVCLFSGHLNLAPLRSTILTLLDIYFNDNT